MQQKLEQITSKHPNLLIDELHDKNITGVKLIRLGNKVMLLFDKTLLSKTNQQILNAINAVYPNIIISINDSEHPFNYEELYEPDSEKPNKKVRPHVLHTYSFEHPKQDGVENSAGRYLDRFRFTGIELDTNVIPAKDIQFGYFLEFINALQEQDVINYEELDVLDRDTVLRHEHYLKNGRPDTKHINLWVMYNEKLEEYSNDLRVANDPYLPQVFVVRLNEGEANHKTVNVKLTLERIRQNVQDYLRRTLQGNAGEQRIKSISEHNSSHRYQIDER